MSFLRKLRLGVRSVLYSLLGVDVVVMSGVSIGEGAGIGSNSVDPRSISDYDVWAGRTAVKIKDRA